MPLGFRSRPMWSPAARFISVTLNGPAMSRAFTDYAHRDPLGQFRGLLFPNHGFAPRSSLCQCSPREVFLGIPRVVSPPTKCEDGPAEKLEPENYQCHAVPIRPPGGWSVAVDHLTEADSLRKVSRIPAQGKTSVTQTPFKKNYEIGFFDPCQSSRGISKNGLADGIAEPPLLGIAFAGIGAAGFAASGAVFL